MSSILKALEKAEESNSTKRMPGDCDLIRSRKSRPTWVMPCAVLCGAAVATLVTFAIMGGFSRSAPSAKVPVAVAKAAPAPAPVVATPLNTVIETPAIIPEQGSPAGAVRAAAVQDPKPAPLASQKAATKLTAKVTPLTNPKAITPAKVKVGTSTNAKSGTQVNAQVLSQVKSKTASLPTGKARAVAAKVQAAPVQAAPSQGKPEAATAEVPVPARAEPKVSGIAWQTNGESSFAVVNGRAVLQGSTVDGFKVLEIHPDAVKFSGSNGTFEVPLGGEDK
jgi:general secretion pathway protein B